MKKKEIKVKSEKKYDEKIQVKTNFNDTIKALLNTKPIKKTKKEK